MRATFTPVEAGGRVEEIYSMNPQMDSIVNVFYWVFHALLLAFIATDIFRRIFDRDQRWRMLLRMIIPVYWVSVILKSLRPGASSRLRTLAITQLCLAGVLFVSPAVLFAIDMLMSHRAESMSMEMGPLKPEYPHVAVLVDFLTDASQARREEAIRSTFSGNWFDLEPIIRKEYGDQITKDRASSMAWEMTHSLFVTKSEANTNLFYLQSKDRTNTRISQLLMRYAQSEEKATTPPSKCQAFIKGGPPVSLRVRVADTEIPPAHGAVRRPDPVTGFELLQP